MIRVLSEGIGKGVVAGLAGTAAMTIASTVEMKIRGRGGSDAPAQAAGKLLGVEPTNDEGKQRFSNIVHWGYGTAWGAVHGILAAAGLREPQASLAHFGLVWGTALWMLPSLGAAPKPTEWGIEEIAIDGLHHAVYATAVGVAYRLIEEN